jgi:hypothetical protein
MSRLDCCTEDNVWPIGFRTLDRRSRSYLHLTFRVVVYLTFKETILSALKYVLTIARVLSVEILLFIYFRKSSLSEQMNVNSSDWIKRMEKVNKQFEMPVNFKRCCYSLSFCHCRQPLIFGRAYQTVPVAKMRYSTFGTTFLIVIIFSMCVQDLSPFADVICVQLNFSPEKRVDLIHFKADSVLRWLVGDLLVLSFNKTQRFILNTILIYIPNYRATYFDLNEDHHQAFA